MLSAGAARLVLFAAGFRGMALMQFMPSWLCAHDACHLMAAVMAVFPLTAALAPLWGAAAERHGTKAALLLAYPCGAAAVCLIALPGAASAPVVLLALTAVAGACAAAGALENTLAVEAARRAGTDFGAFRVYVSLGAGAGSALVGWLADWFGLGVLFAAQALCAAVGVGALLLGHPREAPPRSPSVAPPTGGEEPGEATGSGVPTVGALLRRRGVPLLLANVLVHGALLQLKNVFFGLYMTETLGASRSAQGIAVAAGTLSELPVLLFLPPSHLGLRGSFVLAAAAFAANAALLAALPGGSWGVGVAVALNALHGLQAALFASTWVVGAAQLAPAQGSAMLQTAAFACSEASVGGGLGVAIWGYLWEALGQRGTFAFAAAAAATWTAAWAAAAGGSRLLPEVDKSN
eukprot:TRINITY_DN15182_c0_g1_i1.p1 TRINITY_DN15182_c0_g1~~TRINITY_DN15182_c0_g1_i1.p1  ORF type:complete len:441 (+),score=130.24 TRINITY_DN15182_c0_g1_i1:105-1325(+)